MLSKIIYLLYLVVSEGQSETFRFIEEFIFHQNRPTNVISFMDATSYMSTRSDYLPKYSISFQENLHKVCWGEHTLFVADLNESKTHDILLQAQNRKLLRIPSRWMLFYNSQTVNSSHESNNYENSSEFSENDKEIIEDILNDVNIAINTEVYIVAPNFDEVLLFSIYRRTLNVSFVWEDYAVWTPASGIRCLTSVTLPMRRRDIEGLPVGASTVMSGNYSAKYFEDYLQRDIDTMAKYTHHMVKHLFEWVNGSGFVNYTNSWGYIQKDGRFNGVMREMEDGRADISGSPLVPSLDRLPIVEFIIYPAPIAVDFLFKKPTLAAVTNIFVLPFSCGVWYAAVGLIAICSLTLVVASFNEHLHRDEKRKQTLYQRISDCIHDTLCLVFQQGTSQDPISLTARQILLLGLLAFMFLFTAYSANVVALLQTTTNEVNSVEALLRSPLSLGVQDTIYNRYYFTTDSRPAHKALWKTKLQPNGDKAFLSIEEGIRRVRQVATASLGSPFPAAGTNLPHGMYAYHVEQTAGFDEIQRTFLENEKCNIGAVKFIEARYPYISITRESRIREVLKIGIRRLMESGVQARSTRRVIAAPPKCGSSVAMFSAVTRGDVAPAFIVLMIAYAAAVLMLIAEIFVSRKVNHHKNISGK